MASHTMKYIPILGFLLFAILISGCTGSNVVAPTAPATPTITPTPGPSAIATMIPSSTLRAPSAYFRFGISGDSAPLTVTFTDESMNDPTSWAWSFGDGSISTEQDPVHNYAGPGDYNVSLTVKNDNGQDTCYETIRVKVTPTPGQGGYVPLPQKPTPVYNVQITAVNFQLNYKDIIDNYFGPVLQNAMTTPFVSNGITMFSCSFKLTNLGPGYHTVDSIKIITPGFTLVSVKPGMPTDKITPGSDVILTLTIQAPAGGYKGPLNIEVDPS